MSAEAVTEIHIQGNADRLGVGEPTNAATKLLGPLQPVIEHSNNYVLGLVKELTTFFSLLLQQTRNPV